MKWVPLMASALLVAYGCADNGGAALSKEADSTTIKTSISLPEKPAYLFTIDQPYNEWQPGDQKHAVNIMNSLKAYEAGDIDAFIGVFGDSVMINFDRHQGKLSRDSIKGIFGKLRGKFSTVKVIIQDWESVVSRDKKQEYVTLWYKQLRRYKTGRIDSLSAVDDLRIVNGKVSGLNQKIQHFPWWAK